MAENVIILECDDGSGDLEWTHVGRPHAAIKAELAERFANATSEVMRGLNRVDKDRHVEDISLQVYCNQFDYLVHKLVHHFTNIDVGDELNFKVKEVTAAEWEKVSKREE